MVVDLGRCPVEGCRSTEGRIRTTRRQEFGGETADGIPYTHIVRRWVECKGCGQMRVERSFELIVAPAPSCPAG